MPKENYHFHTFANLPFCADISQTSNKIVLIGIPFFCEYPGEGGLSSDAPDIIRIESNRYPEDPQAWDFDLGGSLEKVCNKKIVDIGNLAVTPGDKEGNRHIIETSIKEALQASALPVVLGGDDSIPIPVIGAYEGQEPFFVLQLDAHIDWRDEINGVREGYSSTMRRASEMPWVRGIIQLGARGVGSAREEELRAAEDYGAKIITAKEFHEKGKESFLSALPLGSFCFLTIDFDVLDPSIMPAVGAPTPGGLYYQETIDLLHAVAMHTSLVGVCLTELAPKKDLNHLGAITAMRLVWNILGAAALARY